MRGTMKLFLCSALILLGSFSCFSEIHTESIEYRHKGEKLQGYVAYDDSIEGERPGGPYCPRMVGAE